MTQNKTQPTDKSIDEFIKSQPEHRHEDCFRLVQIMSEITNDAGTLWGPSIVGFGHYHYKYESGREGDFFQVGFSPRKQNLTIYVMAGFGAEHIMNRLGTYKTGKSCLYVKSLSDIDEEVLKELIHYSIKKINEKYPPQ